MLLAPAVALLAALTGLSPGETSTQPRAPRHVSLLIGVGNYAHVNTKDWQDAHLKNLAAPTRDVRLMQRALRNWQFPTGEDQLVLVDRAASKEGIRRGFEWVASRATDSRDVVVIYYSGHGSWAADRAIDAVRTLDEARASPGDTFDEALIPWDAREPHNPEHLVLDDEIGAWLAQLRTRNVTMIVDGCFSGTITRGDDSGPGAPVARGPRPPLQPRPLQASNGALEGGHRMNHTLITASAAHQTAIEKAFHPGAVVSGVFTRALVESIDGAGPNARFDEVMQTVHAAIGNLQTPQLEGDGSARLFKVGAEVVVPSRGYALVLRDDGREGHIGIDVGAMHGVRKGMLYDVYGPGETSFSGRPLRQVRVDSVLEASSFARMLPGTGTVPASARAVLSRVPRGAVALERLRLYVDPSANALRDSLSALTWIQLTDRAPMATLRKRGNAFQVLTDGRDLAPLSSDHAVSGRTMPAEASIRGYTGSVSAVCGPLRRAFSIAAMDLVRNSHPPPPDRLRLALRVLRAGIDPSSPRAAADDTVRVGDAIQIWFRVDIPAASVAHSPLYVSLALAGYAATPSVIWPRGAGPLARLTAQQVNAWIPVLASPVVVAPPTGVEQVKAVVSSDPFDLRELVADLPSCQLRRDAPGSRAAASDLVVTGWTAVDRHIEILPRAP